jgi:hypothetical protein
MQGTLFLLTMLGGFCLKALHHLAVLVIPNLQGVALCGESFRLMAVKMAWVLKSQRDLGQMRHCHPRNLRF